MQVQIKEQTGRLITVEAPKLHHEHIQRPEFNLSSSPLTHTKTRIQALKFAMNTHKGQNSSPQALNLAAAAAI
jgi:hypothetical protein